MSFEKPQQPQLPEVLEKTIKVQAPNMEHAVQSLYYIGKLDLSVLQNPRVAEFLNIINRPDSSLGIFLHNEEFMNQFTRFVLELGNLQSNIEARITLDQKEISQ